MPLYTTGLALACAAGGDGPTLLLVTVDLGWLLKEEITLAKAAGTGFDGRKAWTVTQETGTGVALCVDVDAK